MLNLIKEKLKSDVSIIMIGTVLSQVILFATAPLLTRLFSPEDFGVFGMYYSILMIISVFITGRYELAIMLPQKDEDAVQLVGGSVLITLVIVLLAALVLVIVSVFSSLGFSMQFSNWLYLLPIGILLLGVYQALNYWFNRKANYKRLATSRISRSVNTVAFSGVFSFTGFKSGGLILGDILGQFSATLVLLYRFFKSEKELIKQIKWIKIKVQLNEYKHFPLYGVPSTLLEKVAGQLPVLLLTAFFGVASAGFFSFSQRVISAPEAVISRAFGDVFRQQASEQYYNNGECLSLFKKNFLRLVLLSIVPFSVLIIFSPFLFEFIFGKEWRLAGEYTQIMTPMFFLQFIISPLSIMFMVAQKQKPGLYIQIFLLVLVLFSFIVGYYFFENTKITIALFSLSYCLKYIVEGYFSYEYSKGTNTPNKL